MMDLKRYCMQTHSFKTYLIFCELIKVKKKKKKKEAIDTKKPFFDFLFKTLQAK